MKKQYEKPSLMAVNIQQSLLQSGSPYGRGAESLGSSSTDGFTWKADGFEDSDEDQ